MTSFCFPNWTTAVVPATNKTLRTAQTVGNGSRCCTDAMNMLRKAEGGSSMGVLDSHSSLERFERQKKKRPTKLNLTWGTSSENETREIVFWRKGIRDGTSTQWVSISKRAVVTGVRIAPWELFISCFRFRYATTFYFLCKISINDSCSGIIDTSLPAISVYVVCWIKTKYSSLITPAITTIIGVVSNISVYYHSFYCVVSRGCTEQHSRFGSSILIQLNFTHVDHSTECHASL